MGEINQPLNAQKDSRIKRKILSTRVDLTPMVDLGFLLITFFIFTTTMSEPHAMKLVLPDDSPTNNPTTASESKTLNLIPGERGKWYTYNGNDLTVITVCANTEELRTVIQERRKAIQQKYNDAQELVVLIKPSSESTYEQVINTFDEMIINAVSRHVLMELNPEEKKAIALQ